MSNQQEQDLFGAVPQAPQKDGAGLFVSRGPAIATAFGDDEVAVLHGPGLSAIIQERLSQISRLGYSLETDIARGPAHLAEQARRFLGYAIDQLQPGERQCLEAARKNLIRAGAMAIAALDTFPDSIGASSAPIGGGTHSGCSPAAPVPITEIPAKSAEIDAGGDPNAVAGVASDDLIFDDPDFEGNPNVND
ncbi:hypothetical protein [Sphingomonas sp. LaA6.9]|uniref:hypothetical protein n=1 Tax=Sphingomonas sp. LaA6.9 TaxID=2919914 RepID=UPI001F4F9596|nr:hypothetical protein [Sphingomonas sp. LaA6.9]MCJ8158828.1 hypothetical protein [Sphingomonas sp. LaA6.9]